MLAKRGKQQRWKAGKEAHQAYEKILSKFLKEKKAAAKKEHAATKTPTATTPAKDKWYQWGHPLPLGW